MLRRDLQEAGEGREIHEKAAAGCLKQGGVNEDEAGRALYPKPGRSTASTRMPCCESFGAASSKEKVEPPRPCNSSSLALGVPIGSNTL